MIILWNLRNEGEVLGEGSGDSRICVIGVVMNVVRKYKGINQWWRWARDGDTAPLGVYRGLPADYASWPVSCRSPLIDKRVLLLSEAVVVADHANS